MKKLYIAVPVLVVLAGLLVYFGSPDNDLGTGNDSAKNSGPITLSQEFSYLPLLEGMVLKEFNKAESGNLASATYTMPDGKYDTVLKDYEAVLKRDGWKTTNDLKPGAMTVEKGEHLATIVPQQQEKGIVLLIYSK